MRFWSIYGTRLQRFGEVQGLWNSSGAMAYEITVNEDFVRAEFVGGETVEETKEFLRAVARYSAANSSFLIRIRTAKAVFRLEELGLIEYFGEVARSASHKIALLADTSDLQAAHEYLELIARQHGLNVRSFRAAPQAVRWLKDNPKPEAA